jgi:hypothetical protein
MTDEVGGDDSGIALEARLRREITDQLLRDLAEAEVGRAMHEGRTTHERGAVLLALAKVGICVQRITALERDLGRFSGPVPDGGLHRLGRALAGLDEGTVDPILKPATEPRRRVVDAAEDKHQGIRAGPTANVLTARATAAAAVEILMLAGRSRKAAAQEVSEILKGSSVLASIKGEEWAAVARWREEIKERGEKREFPDMLGQGVDLPTQAAGEFNFFVGVARRWLDAGDAPERLVKLAHDLLVRLGADAAKNSGLARGSPNAPKSTEGA